MKNENSTHQFFDIFCELLSVASTYYLCYEENCKIATYNFLAASTQSCANDDSDADRSGCGCI
ncbi:Uncharacterised protein [Mycobacteroides abscessus subsp. bolletii]|nr:Uncharacterised protein [Mycobacteroides abscessus subsp. bolletii]